nr:MAG TPA: prohead serine protease [Caudoviricetes sp.]
MYGDIVTREALESLKKQMIGLNVFLDHDYDYDKVIGVVKSSELSDDELYATVAVTKDYQEDIKSKIEFGVNLGFSIGGFADRDKNNTNLISNFNLIELSLTPLPANWDSYGSVTNKNGVMVGNCITKLCYKMLNLESEKMTEQEQLTTEEATNLFNELMANKEEEIESRIMEKVNNNIEQIVEEKVNAQLENNTSKPEDNQPSEELEKHFNKLISKNFIELEANLGKQQEEIFKKYIKQSTPTPTPNPTPEPPVKKTYNNEQLYKQFKSNKGQNFFEKLGFTE